MYDTYLLTYSAASDPISVKCGMLSQNDMKIMAMRSKLNKLFIGRTGV